MRHRHVLAVDRIARPLARRVRREMGDDLVAVEIEVDPMVGAASLRAAEQLAVEAPRGGKIVDRKGEMERRQGHAPTLSLRAKRSNPVVFMDCFAATAPRNDGNEMLYVLYAFLAGAVSAFAFEPVGWWPLMLVAVAFAVRVARPRRRRLGRSLLIGWAFGFGQFVVGLNWIATAFTFQAAMPAWLGWVAVRSPVALSRRSIRRWRPGSRWRFGRDDRVVMVTVLGGAWAITEWLRGSMFTGFPWNPAAAVLAPTPLITITPLIGTYGLSAIVVLLGGAIWLEYYKKWLPLVVILGVTTLLWLLPSSPVPARSADDHEHAHRPAQHRPAGQMAPGLRRGGRAAPGRLVGPADRRAAPVAVARSRGHRSARGRAHRRARADGASSSARAPLRCSGPTTAC